MFDPGENSILLISLTLMKHKKKPTCFYMTALVMGEGVYRSNISSIHNDIILSNLNNIFKRDNSSKQIKTEILRKYGSSV